MKRGRPGKVHWFKDHRGKIWKIKNLSKFALENTHLFDTKATPVSIAVILISLRHGFKFHGWSIPTQSEIDRVQGKGVIRKFGKDTSKIDAWLKENSK